MSVNPKVAPKRQGQRLPRLDSLKNPQPRPTPQATIAQRNEAPTTCTNPECAESNLIDEDGKLICTSCGNVIQEMHIVSEISFAEASNGAATVQGSHVAADQSYARAPSGQRLKMSGGMDSREITEANGRRYVSQLCAALTIPGALQDRGMQFFKLAAGFNFIQGRRTKAVAAVCLYVGCRTQRGEGNKFMLIDFSDILMLNVFKLGQTYTALLKALDLNHHRADIQLINPEDLIWRFSGYLEFGDSRSRVCNEAVRIVQRMNRDWMTTGRRPAGICGGALILAARMNNFRRTTREMSHIVKVAEVTILKRLDEFKVTESSGLTVDEFRTIDLERACDPPAFYEQKDGKKKRSRKRKFIELDDEEPSDICPERATSVVPPNTNDQLQTPANTQSQAQSDAQSMPPPPVPIDPVLLQISAQRLSELQSSPNRTSTSPSPSTNDNAEPPTKRKRGRKPGKLPKPPPPSRSELEHEAAIESEITDFVSDPSNVAQASALHSSLDGAPAPPSPPSTQQQPIETTPTQSSPRSPSPQDPSLPKPSHEPPTNLKPSNRTLSDPKLTTSSVLSTIPSTPIIPDFEFASDPEVLNCLLSPAEIAIKERIWVHENREYLRAQSAKLLKQQLAEQNGTARQIVRRKRRRGRMGDVSGYGLEGGGEGDGEGGEGGGARGPRTPAEATMMMMKRRGYSRKINYKAIDDLYVPSSSGGSRASSHRPDSWAGSPGDGNPGDANHGKTVGKATEEGERDGSVEAEENAADGNDANNDEDNPDDYVDDDVDYDDEGEGEGGQTLEDIVAELREEGELEDDDGGYE